MTHFRKIFIHSLLLLPLGLVAQQAPTLRELVDSAMAQDGTLRNQILENRYTHLVDEKLRSLFLPKLEISGKTAYTQANLQFQSPEITVSAVKPVFPGMQIPAGQLNDLLISGVSAAAKAEANVLIYSGGKVKYLREANREKNLSEQVLMDKTKDEVITEISKAYDQLALIRETGKTLAEAEKRLEINRKTADKALSYGLITPYDHKKIELAQAVLDSKIAEYEGKKELLMTQLSLLTGIERARISQISAALEPIANVVSDFSIENRSEIQALNHGIKATDYKIKAEERWWVPKVQAQSSLSYLGLYGGNISSKDELLPGRKLDINPSNLNILPLFEAGIAFKWDVFDGNEGRHAIEKAKIDREILNAKRQDALKKLQLNLASQQTGFKTAVAQVSLKLKAKEIAHSALQQVEKEFRYGTKTSSALIEAENDLQNAELELQTAIFNQRRAAIELMKATQNLNIDAL